ncbi:MAG: hypothetical protein Q4D85_00635 [Corynebacterium sp.]|uniref:hypothetical protein n=1 Tax=Corynebacterium sp. TaxID=1720 RepID=UPI0026DC4769|nr:hypothetical protein [Corynebacterium sp.]MDO5097232.1 hypothetical protein [Corynebacterium sp.]
MIRRLFTAATLAVAVAFGGAPLAAAQPLPGSSTVQFVLPNDVLAFADQHHIAVPEQLRPDDTPVLTSDLRARLKSATEKHLTQSGHKHDLHAQAIAQEWAQQAVNGQVVFYGNAGDGVTHLDKGSGNVYKMTPAEAEAHIAWLSRTPNDLPGGKHFGVATAAKSGHVYLVEYFLN